MLAFAAIILWLPGGTAQSPEASAEAEPAVAAPGQEISLIFTVHPPQQAQVELFGQVECTIQDPSGRVTQVCERGTGLAEIQVIPGGPREFVFAYNAPVRLGAYVVHFYLNATVRLLPETYEAETGFRVVSSDGDGSTNGGGTPLPTPGTPSPGDSPPVATGGGTPGPGGMDDPSVGPGYARGASDAAFVRYFVSSTGAGAALVASFVARRFPLGGIP